MTANIRIVHTNHIDASPEDITPPTMTCTQAGGSNAVASGSSIANLRNPARDKVLTITGTSPYDFKISWSTARTVSYFGMFHHSLAGGTVRVYLYSDTAWTTNVYDSTALTINPALTIGSHTWGINPASDYNTDRLLAEAPYSLWIPATTGVKSAKITISSSATIKEIGRMWLGHYYEFGINPDIGVSVGWSNNTVVARTEGGSVRIAKGRRWRRMEMNLASLTDSERAIMLDLIGVNTGRDVVVSLFPEVGGRTERDYTIDGIVTSQNPIVYTNFSYRSQSIVLEEC